MGTTPMDYMIMVNRGADIPTAPQLLSVSSTGVGQSLAVSWRAPANEGADGYQSATRHGVLGAGDWTDVTCQQRATRTLPLARIVQWSPAWQGRPADNARWSAQLAAIGPDRWPRPDDTRLDLRRSRRGSRVLLGRTSPGLEVSEPGITRNRRRRRDHRDHHDRSSGLYFAPVRVSIDHR